MSSSSHRLDIVRQVFEKKEQEYLRRLGEFQAQLDQAMAQLRQLRSHRDRQLASLQDGVATDPGRLQNLQAFQQRLNEAISQQELLIQRAKVERDELRNRWLTRRARTRSMEKLCDERRKVEDREELMREQKQQDEFTQTTRLPNSGTGKF